ncbi:ABC transporter permease [Oceanobacillus luteolus]|uniref:ABC transporter permease n=1 Tax=Oceanobacillus luteolus TaxID=1274358 RepID=A0ABW4HSB9_9BACI|nr:ABC transporter permease [Oceanobacillus luteolus]MCM3739625.1 ABC transporter permease [Oceanobacillus luteolus]
MKGIFLARLTSFFRSPGTFLLFTGMSIVFTLILGGVGGYDKITVPVSGDESLQTEFIGEALEESDVYNFKWQEVEDLKETIRRGNAEAGVILKENGYEMIVGIDSSNVQMIEQTVADIYVNKIQEENISELLRTENEEEREELLMAYQEAKENPVFGITNRTFHSSDAFIFDRSLHSIFGFTLFFVIYTICYTVLPIFTQKGNGVWDRMILSPLKKSEMYIGNLIYSFFEGYLQILVIFFVFRYLVGFDFNGELPGILLIMAVYSFAIVSLAIFITSVVKNIQQFNAALPILSVSMAMIGGAFWPIEIVQSEFLLTLSKINPLTYGMEALNGLVLYNQPIQELLKPISILILMGVIFMGVGIHLMERRHI